MAEQRDGVEKDLLQFGETIDGLRADDDDAQITDFLEINSFDDGTTCNGLLSIQDFENPYFGSSGDDARFNNFLESILLDDGTDSFPIEDSETLDVGSTYRTLLDGSAYGFVDGTKNISTLYQGCATRRLRLQKRIEIEDNHVENQEFGRDTNRLDYFRVTAFDVQGNDDLSGIASFGGGGVRNRDVSVGVSSDEDSGDGGGGGGPRLEQERRSGGRRPRRVPVRISPNNDRRGGVKNRLMRLRNSLNSGGGGGGSGGGDGGRRGRGAQIVPVRVKHERDNVDAGGGNTPQQVLVGISPNSGGGGGGGEEEEKRGGLVVVGWWEKWWILLSLWKIV